MGLFSIFLLREPHRPSDRPAEP